MEHATPPSDAHHNPKTLQQRIQEEFRSGDARAGLMKTAEVLLKHPGHVVYDLVQNRQPRTGACLLGIAAICVGGYGLLAGAFSGAAQMGWAALKCAGGLLVSAVICLPSLLVFSCLTGARGTMGDIVRFLVASLALAGLLLVGFAPIAWLFGQSTGSVAFMAHLHLAFWGVALVFGLKFLVAAISVAENERAGHLVTWALIFTLVTFQMMTTLRPIIGTAETILPTEKQFFLQHWGEMMFGDE